MIRIGEVAERSGVTPRTIRYYEEIGLLAGGERAQGRASRLRRRRRRAAARAQAAPRPAQPVARRAASSSSKPKRHAPRSASRFGATESDAERLAAARRCAAARRHAARARPSSEATELRDARSRSSSTSASASSRAGASSATTTRRRRPRREPIAREEEIARAELRLERERLVRRQRDEQAAGRLRVVAEREQLLGDAVRFDRRELAVARIAAGARRLRARRRARRRAPATRRRRARCARRCASAISCVWPNSPKPVTSVTAFGANARSTSAAAAFSVVIQRDRLGAVDCFAASTRPVPSGFVRKTASPGRAPLFGQIAVRMHGADDREAVLRLGVADRVAAGEHRAGRAHLLVGAGEDRARTSRSAAPPGTRRSRARAAARRPSRRRR